MTADLSALIARLEAAYATGIIMESEAIALQSAIGLEDAYDTDWKQCCWNALKGSLDAALALAEMVLPGCSPGMSQNVHSRDWFAWLGYAEGGEAKLHAQTFGTTPALALCIAVLKAKQGEGE